MPIVGTVAEMVVGVKLDAAKPADNIYCDVNYPLWWVFRRLMPLLSLIVCVCTGPGF